LVVIKEKTEEDGSITFVKKYFGKRHLKKRIDVFQKYGLEVVGIEKVFLS
jgi:hypothetical protein